MAEVFYDRSKLWTSLCGLTQRLRRGWLLAAAMQLMHAGNEVQMQLMHLLVAMNCKMLLPQTHELHTQDFGGTANKERFKFVAMRLQIRGSVYIRSNVAISQLPYICATFRHINRLHGDTKEAREES